MRNIIIRKSVRDEIKQIIPALTEKAITWMKRKYPDMNFNNTDFIFSAGYRRSRYFRNEVQNAKYITPNVCICTREKLYLYDKRSLGIKKTEMFVGSEIQMMCALIHELTHHMQYEQNKRKGNELDTTRNELEYLKELYPEIYKEIVN